VRAELRNVAIVVSFPGRVETNDVFLIQLGWKQPTEIHLGWAQSGTNEQGLRQLLPFFLSRPLQSSTVESGDRRVISLPSVDSPSSSSLAPSPASEEEGDWLNRRRSCFPYVYSLAI
jgi:hypothetical protein